jgi:8-oxo-dGTP pyrophosphatase MutT (NUDIX family)
VQTDNSHVHAALRETCEELGILPSQVEILGELAPVTKSLHGLTVHPYVVCIHYTGNLICAHLDDATGFRAPIRKYQILRYAK